MMLSWFWKEETPAHVIFIVVVVAIFARTELAMADYCKRNVLYFSGFARMSV